MNSYMGLFFISLFLTLWNGIICCYHLLPKNELGDKYIPKLNIILNDIFYSISNYISRFFDTTNINYCTIFIICTPVLIEIILFIINMVIIILCLHSIQNNFSIIFMIASDTYDGLYEIFFNLTTFFATFANSHVVPPYQPCLDYSPVTIIKQAIAFAIISFMIECIILRVIFCLIIYFIFIYNYISYI